MYNLKDYCMIISGKELSKSLKEELKVRVAALDKEYGRTPNLVVILVGDDPGSVSYVTGKAKAADEVGIRNTTLRREATITEDELLALVEELNNDNDVDGILVQLPLPKHIDEKAVREAIAPHKDVDGVTRASAAAVYTGSGVGFCPCTACAVMGLIR